MNNNCGAPAIETLKLSKKYGELTALDSVDLEIARGESFALLGPNGAGKTTMISILSTLIRPTGGTAKVAGLDVVSEQAAVRSKIGIVFQDPSLDEKLTARENLAMHCSLYGVPGRERSERMAAAFDLVELSDRQNDLVKTFSGGMRRRLEIARCLVHTPEVMFLDEPTIGLDPQTRDHIWTYLEKLAKEHGITTVLTTHYMDEADRLCGRVAIIDFGKIAVVDTPQRLKKEIGENVVTLVCNKPSELLDILQLTDVEMKSAVIQPDKLTLNVAAPEAVLSSAFRAGESLGIEVNSVSISHPTLNDVFLKYTGRDIRDEKNNKANSLFAMRMYAKR